MIRQGESEVLQHFLSIESLDQDSLHAILNHAESFLVIAKKPVKKVPLLRGFTVVNLFFEASTRTRTSFELAAKRLSADVIDMNVTASATSKGESLLDTLHTLEAMHCNLFIVRHPESGAAHFIARHVDERKVRVINAGDGRHAHPTQALLDMFTLYRHKRDFSRLVVAIVGDILHSRVARSEIRALQLLGVREIRVIAPDTLLPAKLSTAFGVQVYRDMDAGLDNVDVIVALRVQRERIQGPLLSGESEYFQRYGVTPERLRRARSDVLVMHPGPINRGVEIDSRVADGKHAVILQQVSHGIAVRMAILALVANGLSVDNGNNTT